MRNSSITTEPTLKRRSALSERAVPITFFFLFFGVGAVQPFVVPYLRDRHPEVTLFQARMIIATIYLVFAPCRFLAGAVMRRLSRQNVIRLGALGYLGFVVALRYGRSYPVFLAGAVLIALGAGLIWTASSAQVLDSADRRRYGAASGVLYFFTKSGIALGVLALGALVHEGSDYTLFFRTSMTIGAAALLCTLLIPSEPRMSAKCPDRNDLQAPTLAFVRGFLSREGNWIIPFMLCVSFASYGILLTLVSSVARQEFGAEYVGRISACYYGLGVLFSYIGGRISDWTGRRRVLLASFACGGLAMLLLAWAKGPVGFGLAAALFGVQFGAIPSVAMAWVGDVTTPQDRPAAHASTFAWRDLGAGGAAVLVACLAEGGFAARQSFIMFAGIFFATVALVAWAMWRYRPSPRSE